MPLMPSFLLLNQVPTAFGPPRSLKGSRISFPSYLEGQSRFKTRWFLSSSSMKHCTSLHHGKSLFQVPSPWSTQKTLPTHRRQEHPATALTALRSVPKYPPPVAGDGPGHGWWHNPPARCCSGGRSQWSSWKHVPDEKLQSLGGPAPSGVPMISAYQLKPR